MATHDYVNGIGLPHWRDTVRTIVETTTDLPFERVVEDLVRTMGERFPGLTYCGNPAILALSHIGRDAHRRLIQEYTGFTNAAVHLLFEARIRNRWPALAAEIAHNIDEEMGALTGGVPHLELMRSGYLSELSIETDGIGYGPATRCLVEELYTLFATRDNGRLAGALLAFEATAVDEFRVVDALLRSYRLRYCGADILPDSLTGRYIAGHVTLGSSEPGDDPEMEHFRGMLAAVSSDVTRETRPAVAWGFFAVCDELNRWWGKVASFALAVDSAPSGYNQVASRNPMYAMLGDG